MGYKCPKCGYERQSADLAPEYECPKCGVIYEKALKRLNLNDKTQQDVNNQKEKKIFVNHLKKHFYENKKVYLCFSIGMPIVIVILTFFIFDFEKKSNFNNIPEIKKTKTGNENGDNNNKVIGKEKNETKEKTQYAYKNYKWGSTKDEIEKIIKENGFMIDERINNSEVKRLKYTDEIFNKKMVVYLSFTGLTEKLFAVYVFIKKESIINDKLMKKITLNLKSKYGKPTQGEEIYARWIGDEAIMDFSDMPEHFRITYKSEKYHKLYKEEKEKILSDSIKSKDKEKLDDF